MPQDITIDLGGYVSSKRASEMTGYAQDYIGQLARGGHIDARRIGGLWYVSIESLTAYKDKAGDIKPNPPAHDPGAYDSEAIVSFDGKEYVSANRASKVTGYNQDYIGQLARSGKVLSRQVGNRWYVDHVALLAHQEEKNALLAAVQTQAVGIIENKPDMHNQALNDNKGEPLLSYTTDDRVLLPTTGGGASLHEESENRPVPIRVLDEPRAKSKKRPEIIKTKRAVVIPEQAIFRVAYPAVALTIIIVLSVGLVSLKQHSTYTMSASSTSVVNRVSDSSLVANATSAFHSVMDGLEKLLTTELLYQKEN